MYNLWDLNKYVNTKFYEAEFIGMIIIAKNVLFVFWFIIQVDGYMPIVKQHIIKNDLYFN